MNVGIFGLTVDKNILSNLLLVTMTIQGAAGLAIITIVASIRQESINSIIIPGLLHLVVILLEGIMVLFLAFGFIKCLNILFGVSLIFNVLAFVSFIYFIIHVWPIPIK